MKSRSVIGPVLLVLIGALFLVNNLRPELISWSAVARFWPFVLIGWGALRLVEILVWRFRGVPLPPRGVSGGEWVLVIFICLAGTGISAAHRYSDRFSPIIFRGPGLEIFGESFDFPVSQKAAAGKVSRVVIEVSRGNTRITGADVQEVQVEGRKTVRAFAQSDAGEANRNSSVEIVNQGDQILVRVRDEAGPRDGRVFADLTVTVPRAASIQASGRLGDFDVVDIGGDVEVKSSNAAVRLNNIGGRVRVDLHRSDVVRAVNVKGSVEISLGRGGDVELETIMGEVTIKGRFSGDLSCRGLARPLVVQGGDMDLSVGRVPGELQMDLGSFSAKNVVGPLRLSAKSRDVRIDGFSDQLTLRIEKRGHVELTPRQPLTGTIDVSTGTGKVDLTLPPGGAFQLSASTDQGEVENDFGPPLEVKKDGRGAELAGSVGQGPRIRINTRLGSIRVGKG